MTVFADLLILLGGLLAVVTGVGVLRFSTAYARIHAAGVASPVAFLLVALGSLLQLDLVGAGYVVFAALAALVTLPIGAHLLLRAVHHSTDSSHLNTDDLATAQRAQRDRSP